LERGGVSHEEVWVASCKKGGEGGVKVFLQGRVSPFGTIEGEKILGNPSVEGPPVRVLRVKGLWHDLRRRSQRRWIFRPGKTAPSKGSILREGSHFKETTIRRRRKRSKKEQAAKKTQGKAQSTSFIRTSSGAETSTTKTNPVHHWGPKGRVESTGEKSTEVAVCLIMP